MLRYLYSFLLILATPLLLARLYRRGRRNPAYRRRIPERFGYFRPPPDYAGGGKTLWIHAVSVGETVAAEPLVRALQEASPGIPILFTCMTPTGSDRARALFGGSVLHAYLPYDLPGAVRRFLRRVNPALLIILETELWPNLLHHCRRRGVKTVLANARLSARSARAYGRIPGLTRAMLQSLDAIAAQSTEDAGRLQELGAEPDKTRVTGSLKFNVRHELKTEAADPFFAAIKESGRTVITAASTRAGEEPKVLKAFVRVLQQHPAALLLLVPRHPERFAEVVNLAGQFGLNMIRRSGPQAVTGDIQLVIGGQHGEMPAYYAVADIAFVGGSLVDTGCQNVLEPAAFSLPVLVGPSQFNFARICEQLESAGGLKTVADEQELAAVMVKLLGDESRRRQMGAAARTVIDANQQALPMLLEIIKQAQPGLFKLPG